MKKIFLLQLIFLLQFLHSYSQDTITMKTGELIQAKVEIVKETEVIYKRYDNLKGPYIATLKSDISMIVYENGTKDVFNDEVPSATNEPDINNTLYLKGQQDATVFYKSYSGAATTTLVIGLISPLVGLIPAIATSSTPPSESNLNFPSISKMKNTDYYNGYTQKAKKIKQGKVWTNWGIALGVNLVAVLLITAGN